MNFNEISYKVIKALIIFFPFCTQHITRENFGPEKYVEQKRNKDRKNNSKTGIGP